MQDVDATGRGDPVRFLAALRAAARRSPARFAPDPEEAIAEAILNAVTRGGDTPQNPAAYAAACLRNAALDARRRARRAERLRAALAAEAAMQADAADADWWHGLERPLQLHDARRLLDAALAAGGGAELSSVSADLERLAAGAPLEEPPDDSARRRRDRAVRRLAGMMAAAEASPTPVGPQSGLAFAPPERRGSMTKAG